MVLCVKKESFYQVVGLIKIVMSEVNYQHYLQYLLHSILAAGESYLLEMNKLSFPCNSSFLDFSYSMVRPLPKGYQGFVPWWLVCSGQKEKVCSRRWGSVLSSCRSCLRQGGTLKGLCQAHFHIFAD